MNQVDNRAAEARRERVLYAVLLPAVRMARVFRIPLRTINNLLEMACFHDARIAGMRLREVSEVMGISPRKSAALSKRLKQNFLSADTRVAVPRRIEFLLWAHPLSRARIAQAMPDVADNELDEALERLLEACRVRTVRSGRLQVYERVKSNSRLVSEDWEERIDALGNLLSNTCDTVYGRFFRGDAKAFARTINFKMRAEDTEELAALYEPLWQRITELEQASLSDPNSLNMSLSILWSPDQNLMYEKEKNDESGT